jgi:hypothetical protein
MRSTVVYVYVASALCASSCRLATIESTSSTRASAELADDSAVVGVVVEDASTLYNVCTGIVIAPQVVLTAAQCVPPNFRVVDVQTSVVIEADAAVSLVDPVSDPVAVTLTAVDEGNRIGLVGLRAPIDGVAPHKTRAPRDSDVGGAAVVRDHVQTGVNVEREAQAGTIAAVGAQTLDVDGTGFASLGAAVLLDDGGGDGEVVAAIIGLDAAESCGDGVTCRADSFDDLQASFIIPFVADHGGVTCDGGDYCDPSCAGSDPDCVTPASCGANGRCVADDVCVPADPDCHGDDAPSCADSSLVSLAAWPVLAILVRSRRSR